MKSLLFILLFIPILTFSQYTAIPDQIFEQALIDLEFDDVVDGRVLTKNIDTTKKLKLVSRNISDLTGIEAFTALEVLICHYNQLTSLDLSKNTALTLFECPYNQLTSLDLSKNTALTILRCNNNQLTSLDVSGCTALKKLVCNNNQLTSLDLSNNTALNNLDC